MGTTTGLTLHGVPLNQLGVQLLSTEQIAEIISTSRAYIERQGWIKEALRDQDGRVCSRGGIVYSQGWLEEWEDEDEIEDLDRITRCHLMQVEAAVMDAIGEDAAALVRWNDAVVSGEQEVLDTFAKAEKLLLNDGVDPDAV